jgi:tRNA nucleotidyltransferase (CCA-adding enzyme)
MALRLEGEGFGEILDPLEGQADLGRGVIRALHPKSFVDDPTRILRAIRYEGRYSFQMDSSTVGQINEKSLKVLHALSGERLRHEFDLIFDEENAGAMMLRVANLGILGSIHLKLPEFNQDFVEFLEMDIHLDVQANRRTMGYMLWFMDLPEDDVILLANRLDFTNELTLAVWAAAQLKRGLQHLTDMKPSDWTYALEKLPLLSIYAVYLVSRENSLLSYISIWRHVKPFTNGDDLKARGLQPGPRFGEILHRLRSAWLDGELTSKVEEEDLLRKMISV